MEHQIITLSNEAVGWIAFAVLAATIPSILSVLRTVFKVEPSVRRGYALIFIAFFLGFLSTTSLGDSSLLVERALSGTALGLAISLTVTWWREYKKEKTNTTTKSC
jgi:hypothetical protein